MCIVTGVKGHAPKRESRKEEMELMKGIVDNIYRQKRASVWDMHGNDNTKSRVFLPVTCSMAIAESDQSSPVQSSPNKAEHEIAQKCLEITKNLVRQRKAGYLLMEK